MQVALYDPATASTARGLMAALWQGSLQAYVSNDPQFGYRLKTDFVDEPCVPGFPVAGTSVAATVTGTTTASQTASGWVAQDAVTAGGTFLLSKNAGKNGGVRINNDGTTADYGTELGRLDNVIVLPSHASTPSKRTVAQVRIDNVDGDFHGFLLTDAGATTPVFGASNLPADVGYIGYLVNESGDLLFVSKSAAAGTADSVTVIAAADFTATDVHVLGFAVNADSSVDLVVDYVWKRTAAKLVDPASLPTGNLAPRFGVTVGNGSTAPTMDITDVDIFVEQ